MRAIQKQAETLIHIFGTDFYDEDMVLLAEKLAKLAPGGVPRRVYFGNSGTKAVEAAIKMVRIRPQSPAKQARAMKRFTMAMDSC